MSPHAHLDRAQLVRASRALSLEAVKLTNRLLDGDDLRSEDVEELGRQLAVLATFAGMIVGVCSTVVP